MLNVETTAKAIEHFRILVITSLYERRLTRIEAEKGREKEEVKEEKKKLKSQNTNFFCKKLSASLQKSFHFIYFFTAGLLCLCFVKQLCLEQLLQSLILLMQSTFYSSPTLLLDWLLLGCVLQEKLFCYYRQQSFYIYQFAQYVSEITYKNILGLEKMILQLRVKKRNTKQYTTHFFFQSKLFLSR